MEELNKLKEDLTTSEQNVKDFEALAIEWKTAYLKLQIKYNIKVKELEQTIEELEKELNND